MQSRAFFVGFGLAKVSSFGASFGRVFDGVWVQKLVNRILVNHPPCPLRSGANVGSIQSTGRAEGADVIGGTLQQWRGFGRGVGVVHRPTQWPRRVAASPRAIARDKEPDCLCG